MMMRRVANSITGLVSNQIALNRCIPNAMAATHAIDSIHPPHTSQSVRMAQQQRSQGNLLFLLRIFGLNFIF